MKPSKKSDEYKSVFGNRGTNRSSYPSSVDWCEATPQALSKLISTVTSRGGAVRFGYTRDGGAYALGLYYGSDNQTAYCRPTENLQDFLEEWVAFYENLPMSNGKSPDQG